MTGGEAVQALELVLRPEREADLLVIVSHEGETPLTLEAARAWRGPRWLVTGRADGPIAELVRRGRRLHAGDRGELVPHRELHLRGRGDRGAARRGHRVAARRRRGGARGAVPGLGEQERFVVAGAGGILPPRTRRC